MNKKAFFALLLAALVPLISYLLVKFYSEKAVNMPRRFFFDSVAVNEKNGKTTNDTIWHHLKNISFTNQLGQKVSLYDIKGKVIVLDFFFTRCPTFCPGMARSMKKLQDSFKKKDTSFVQFISISVDPLHDSVSQLKNFADKHKINPDSWWLVTGDKKDTYNFALQEIKASVADAEVDTGFIHTQNFFLLDREKIVRGWYNAFDSSAQQRLVRDIPLLMLEKERKKTFGEFLKELFGRS
ncbi:MAG TPA: SCO family protein [Chitinophagaceae bacterium]|nr:SCO family protein [Chitinophagaceae bacterium]